MKSSWQELTIDQLKADTKNAIAMGPFGSRIKAENFVDEGIPVIKGGNLNGDFINEDKYDYLTKEKADELKASNAFPLDLVITHRGTIGQVGLIPKNSKYSRYVVSQSQLKVTLDQSKMNPYYLYYFFKSKLGQHRLLMNASQVGVPAIAQASTSVKKILVPHPDVATQDKIVTILLTLDDKIELNRKMNQTLEEMAQVLFKSWFVDFDPVHAKAECNTDDELEAAAKELGISKEVLELFPCEFVESEMGMIPNGWDVAKIEDILKRYRASKRYKKDTIKDYGKTMVLEQGANITLGYHDDDGEFEATATEPMFIFGDHTCVMRLSTKPFSISENVIPLSGCIRNGYWTYYATYGQQTFQEYRRHWSELIVRNIVLAPVDICDYFAERIKPLVLKIEQNRLENNELIMTRETLLPKLLSGELDVSNIEFK